MGDPDELSHAVPVTLVKECVVGGPITAISLLEPSLLLLYCQGPFLHRVSILASSPSRIDVDDDEGKVNASWSFQRAEAFMESATKSPPLLTSRSFLVVDKSAPTREGTVVSPSSTLNGGVSFNELVETSNSNSNSTKKGYDAGKAQLNRFAAHQKVKKLELISVED